MSQSSGKRAAASPLSSEFGKKPKLELEVNELQKLNQSLFDYTGHLPWTSPKEVSTAFLALAFREVASVINDSWNNKDRCEKYINELSSEKRLEFASIWIEARDTRDWTEFANHLLQQIEPADSGGIQELVEDLPPRLSYEQSQKATVESWDIAYVGNAHDLLYQHIGHYSKLGDYYARYTSIVQSSGMGKSRAIDEFSKKHLVVPLNLRKNLDGFPPPDESVRNWLLQSTTKVEAFNRACAYLYALFLTLLCCLQQIDEKLTAIGARCNANLPTKFRLLMTIGQTFSQQGATRKKFYEDVLELANKTWVPVLDSTTPASPQLSSATINDSKDKSEYQLTKAVEDLMKFLIKDFDVLNADTPVLVLSFDEAHLLAEVQNGPSGRWSRFSELRRALRIIHSYPCFSLFLSTTGKVNQFMPQPQEDDSNRIQKGLIRVIPPFCELGFDQLAEKVIHGSTTIDEVASLKFMATLCRPLFAARYIMGDADVKKSIVMFAGEKLLCKPFPSSDESIRNLSDVEKLACISVRIPMEFGLGYRHSREIEQTLVEKHLRVCLQVNPGFETPVTIAASEPLLAEASYLIMSNPAFDLPRTLLNELEHQGLDKGNRGEFIAMVLCLLARDAATRRLDNRVIPVYDFIRELLVSSPHVFCSKPAQARTAKEADTTFEETFGRSKIFFNHFVKLHDIGIINRKHIWVLIARGAAGICANYQVGVDIVIPFLFFDPVLQRQDVSAIFIQCKNNAAFHATARRYLFDMMNPYHIRFFDEKDANPIPVIRMVFALASPTPDVVVLGRPERVQPSRDGAFKASFQGDKYTAFDIWCAAASRKTFLPILDDSTYDQLLRRSRLFPNVFDDKTSEGLRNITRSMNPASGSHPAHYCTYISSS